MNSGKHQITNQNFGSLTNIISPKGVANISKENVFTPVNFGDVSTHNNPNNNNNEVNINGA